MKKKIKGEEVLLSFFESGGKNYNDIFFPEKMTLRLQKAMRHRAKNIAKEP